MSLNSRDANYQTQGDNLLGSPERIMSFFPWHRLVGVCGRDLLIVLTVLISAIVLYTITKTEIQSHPWEERRVRWKGFDAGYNITKLSNVDLSVRENVSVAYPSPQIQASGPTEIRSLCAREPFKWPVGNVCAALSESAKCYGVFRTNKGRTADPALREIRFDRLIGEHFTDEALCDSFSRSGATVRHARAKQEYIIQVPMRICLNERIGSHIFKHDECTLYGFKSLARQDVSFSSRVSTLADLWSLLFNFRQRVASSTGLLASKDGVGKQDKKTYYFNLGFGFLKKFLKVLGLFALGCGVASSAAYGWFCIRSNDGLWGRFVIGVLLILCAQGLLWGFMELIRR